MNSYTSSVEVGFEVLSENLKCSASLEMSSICSVEFGFEAVSENLKCPASLMIS